MMAHELPLQQLTSHHKVNFDGAQTKSSKKGKGIEQTLPNGKPVNFGLKKKQNDNNSQNNGKKQSKKLLPPASLLNDSSANRRSKKTDRTLPNGEKPNFYNNSNVSNGNAASTTANTSSGSKKSEPLLPNGDKPNFNSTAPSKQSKGRKNDDGKKNDTVVEETYAGSSFHSSPAALNLPKPSFKTSPKSNQNTLSTSPQQQHQQQHHQHQQQQQHQQYQQSIVQQSPLLANNLMAANPGTPTSHLPVSVPPFSRSSQYGGAGLLYPVVAYPHTSLPPSYPSLMQNPMIYSGNQFVQQGFTYQHTPQGYINYPSQMPHPQQHPPPHQLPPQYGVPPQFAQSHPQMIPSTPQPQGQKISFNELLGSGK